MHQIKRKMLFIAAIALSVLSNALPAQANLLITPLQVVLGERDRSTEIVLVNTSQEVNTYRLRWEQLDQVEGAGRYVPASDEDREARQDLEDFAVFSPRQITLAPNEKQTVRLAIRRPQELPEGEYLSHLKFAIVPDFKSAKEDNREIGQDEIGIGAKVVASYAIPIIYRVGDFDTQITIGTPNITRSETTNNILLDVSITRSGTHGAVGLIRAYFTPTGGEETEIGALGNASLYSGITKRDFIITTQLHNLSAGSLRINYTKAEGDISKHVVMAEEIFPIGQ